MFGQFPGEVSTDAEEWRQNNENRVKELTRVLCRPHRQPHQPLTNQLKDNQQINKVPFTGNDGQTSIIDVVFR